MKRQAQRRGRHEQRRVVLHRTPTKPEAELWAGACRSVLRDLEVADWWNVDVGRNGEGGWLIAVDYTPRPAP